VGLPVCAVCLSTAAWPASPCLFTSYLASDRQSEGCFVWIFCVLLKLLFEDIECDCASVKCGEDNCVFCETCAFWLSFFREIIVSCVVHSKLFNNNDSQWIPIPQASHAHYAVWQGEKWTGKIGVGMFNLVEKKESYQSQTNNNNRSQSLWSGMKIQAVRRRRTAQQILVRYGSIARWLNNKM